MESIIEKRELEQNEKVQVHCLSLDLEKHKGSLLYPLPNFTPLSPYFRSINFDPPYILHVIANDLNCLWKMAGYEFLKISLVGKLYKPDVRNMCKDITFPFDRG